MADSKNSAAIRISRARDAQLWLSAYLASDIRPVTLLQLGIRDLKQINDLHGHDVGNAVISEVGQRIAAWANGLAGVIMVVRMPGREYLAILEGSIANDGIENAARKLLTAVSANILANGESVHISARIGIAASENGQTGIALLQQASNALANAYGRKGRKYVVAEPVGVNELPVSAELDRSLRKAISERQISIMMQPQFRVSDGHLVGAEALARWQHPAFGEVGAGALFAAADRCDLREELSHLIQQEAIAIAALWPAALDNLRLSINLGAEELGEDYSVRLMALLDSSGFPAERLTLELTEESLVRDIDLASAQLEILRDKGVRIAVDDFGTGYSSLAYLKALPLDYLKLDKGMTPDIDGKGKDRIVLRAIIAMGKALELQIIAEGVEREAELEMLRAEGCDYFQGFLRSQPLNATEFERFALLSN
jgi:diguanylate cyclase